MRLLASADAQSRATRSPRQTAQMNHINIVSFFYGFDSEGLVTFRLAAGLRSIGQSLNVICASEASRNFSGDTTVVAVRSKPFRPAVVFRSLSTAIHGINSHYYCWIERVAKLPGVPRGTVIYGRAQPTASLSA